MTKKVIITPENPDGVISDLTAEEISAKQVADQETETLMQQLADEKQAKENLKASAKAKLVAGTPLTEDEANTIVI